MLGSPAWSFLISWCFYLSGIIAAAFVLNAFGVYVQSFIVHNSSPLVWALIGAGHTYPIKPLGPASEIGKIETFLKSGAEITRPCFAYMFWSSASTYCRFTPVLSARQLTYLYD